MSGLRETSNGGGNTTNLGVLILRPKKRPGLYTLADKQRDLAALIAALTEDSA